MIRPTKHLNLDVCILNIAAHIMLMLRATGAAKYDELLARLQRELSELVRFEYPLALDMLYLLGKIDYDADADSILLTDEARAEVAA